MLGNPDPQPRQTVDGVFEEEKDKSALDAVRDELRNNSLLIIILPIAVDAQRPNHVEVKNVNQERPKYELTIEEAIAMVFFYF